MGPRRRTYTATQIARWLLWGRWVVPLFIVAASAFHEMLLQLLQPAVPPRLHPWTPVAVYGFTGSVVVWFGLGYLARLIAARGQAEEELRRAYEQLKQTHQRLLAMHAIGREIAQADDLRQVLEAAARAPVQLVNAKGAAVLTFNEEQNRLELAGAWGLSEAYLDRFKAQLATGIPADRCRQCAVLEARISDDCPLFEGVKDVARAEGIGSLACLPFGRGERRDGIITAYFPSPVKPPEDDVQLLAIVAAEIASVIESLRLRKQQVTSIYELERLLGTADESTLWRQLLQVTVSTWDVNVGALYLGHEDEEACQATYVYPDKEHIPDALLRGMDDVACRVRRSRSPYVLPDLRVAWPDASLTGSAAGIPLLVGSEMLGAMVLVSEAPGFFRRHHGPFLLSLGHYAGLVINHARLQARVEHMAVVEERYRLAREIHDGLAQSLTFIGWRLDRAATLLRKGAWEALETELEEIRHGLREAYLDVREAIDGLRMNVEHAEGLVGALRDYIASFRARTGLDVLFEAAVDPASIPPQVAVHLLRIAQESLTNVRKHAQATRVHVRLACEGDHLVLSVTDNGRGFDPSAPRGRDRVGLTSMQERARKLNGTLSLTSRPGAGTCVTVRVPLRDVPSLEVAP